MKVVTEVAEGGVEKEAFRASILSELKERTKSLHERVEQVIDLGRALASQEQYGRLLARFHGLYQPMEELIQAALGERMRAELDFEARKKTALLRADLLDLGYSPKALLELPVHPLDVQLSAEARIPSGLGRLYVLEGATLGGRFITGEVARRLGIPPERGARFFSSYGDERGRMWSRFREQLTSYAESNPMTRETIVLSAIDAFEQFEGWFSGGEQ